MIIQRFYILPVLFLSFNLTAGIINLEDLALPNVSPEALVPGRIDYAISPGLNQGPLSIPEKGFSSNGWTVSTWLRLDDTTGSTTLLGANRWDNFRISINGGEYIRITWHSSKGHVSCGMPLHFEKGIWYHLAVTQDADGILKIYRNGELAAEKDMQGAKPSSSAHIGILGAFRPADKEIDMIFKGLIDEPLLYDRALQAEEVQAEFEAGNATLPVIPMPRQVSRTGEYFNRPAAITFVNRVRHADMTAVELYRRIAENITAGGVSVTDCADFTVTLEDISSPDFPEDLQIYLKNGTLPADGYIMTISPDNITVYSDSTSGFHNGMLTAAQTVLLENIPVCTVFDWPEFSCRAALVVIDSQPPAVLTDWLKEQILELGENRFKYMMLRTHDWLMLDDPAIYKAMEDVTAYAAACGITVMPYLQTYSHAKGLLLRNCNFGHTVTVADEAVPVENGKAALSRKLVVNTPDIPVIVTADGMELREGVDYTVAITPIQGSWDYPPEVNAPWPWAKPWFDPEQGEAVITLNGDWANIAEITVTYDCYSNGECTCPYSQEYQEHLANCIAASLAITGSDYINLGMDEIWQIRGSGRCCSRNDHSNTETMAVAFNSGYDSVKAVAPGVRVIIWSDMLDSQQTPTWKVTDATPDFAQYFEKDICMSPWYYSDNYAQSCNIETSANHFLSQGFNLVGTSGKLALNQLLWGESMYKHSLTKPVFGFVYTMWDDASPGIKRGDGYDTYNQASWSPDRIHIPSMLKLESYLRLTGTENLTAVQKESLTALLHAARAEYSQYRRNYPEDICTLQAVKRLEEAIKTAENILQ